jgi:hypothetical protein
MKSLIQTIHFSRLWNSEHPLVINRIAQIIESYNPAALHLDKAYDRLAATLPALALIEVKEKHTALSAEISELDNERDELVIALYIHAKYMSRLKLPSIAPPARVIKSLFERHGHDMATSNYSSETKRIADLLAEIEQNPEVAAAIAALHLTELVNRLATVNSEFEIKFMRRNSVLTSCEKVDARAIRLKADQAIQFVYQAIDFCVAEYPETNYTPMINALNELAAYYNAQIKARQTRREAGKDVAQETPTPKK